jgi:enamine deaminase RidA (YjgF/YER057c/UK114 family)
LNEAPEQRLIRHGIMVPEPRKPVANYLPYTLRDGVIYISGQIGYDPEGRPIRGRMGETMDLDQGAEAARLAGLQVLGQMKAALGSLDRIRQILKVSVFVSSSPQFEGHPAVANGVSDLFASVWGEDGLHARSAVGVAALPLGAAVEVEVVAAYE